MNQLLSKQGPASGTLAADSASTELLIYGCSGGGGGGGGAPRHNPNSGGAGGKGIVVIRYKFQ